MGSKLRGLSKEEFQNLRIDLQSKGILSLNLHGQTLEIETIKDIKSLRRFDPILYWQDGELICHYLWRLNRLFMQDESLLLQTRPLTPLSAPDSLVSLPQILGKPKHVRLPLWKKLMILLHALFMRRF